MEPVEGSKKSPRGPYSIYKRGNLYYALTPEGQPITTGVTKTNLINRMNSAEPLWFEKEEGKAKPSKKSLEIDGIVDMPSK